MDSPSYPDYQPVPVLAKYYPHGVFGHDKEGHPVAYFPLGGIDPKGVVNLNITSSERQRVKNLLTGVTCNCKASDNMKAIFYWQEERLRNCAAASKKVGEIFLITLYYKTVTCFAVWQTDTTNTFYIGSERFRR